MFTLNRQGMHPIGTPIQRADEMDLMTKAGMGGIGALVTAFHPAASHGELLAEGGFVHKEKAASPGLGCFFASSSQV